MQQMSRLYKSSSTSKIFQERVGGAFVAFIHDTKHVIFSCKHRTNWELQVGMSCSAACYSKQAEDV